jgi:hypothetical protein
VSGQGGADHSALARARERDALTALALSAQPNENEIRALLHLHHEWEPPSLAVALTTLTGLGAARLTPRVHVLRHLVGIVARHGTSALHGIPALEDLVAGFVEEGRNLRLSADVDEPLRSPPPPGPTLAETGDPDVDAVLAGLDAVGHIPLGEDPWTVFVARSGDALDLTEAEASPPRCHDSLAVPVDGRRATRVVVWFRSSLAGHRLGEWTNPWTWPAHSLWFESMAPIAGSVPTTPDFRATFREVVRFSDSLVLETDLEFTRTVRAPNLWVCRFELAGKSATKHIGVDTGNIVVRFDPDLPGPCPVEIRAEKYLEFLDPALAAWPTIACDLFWIELCTQMAVCYGGPN